MRHKKATPQATGTIARLLCGVLFVLWLSVPAAMAQTPKVRPDSVKVVLTDKVIANPDLTDERESLFPGNAQSLSYSHFTWGADIGSSIDLRGYDMSTFDIDVTLGYKNRFFRMIGIGAGIHKSFGNGNMFIPVNFILRTSFRTKPSLFFFNLKAGYSFNTISDTPTKGGTNVSLGLGINLAMSPKFQSHIVLSYGYFHLNQTQREAIGAQQNHVDEAQIRFGVNF